MKSRLAVLLFITVASATLAAGGAFKDQDVIGRWYRGDHLGYSLVLVIAPDHSYTAKWSGDEVNPVTGDTSYGKASGRWAIRGDRLVIKPSNETKGTEGDLETMKIVRRHGKIRFVLLKVLKMPSEFHLDPMMVFEPFEE